MRCLSSFVLSVYKPTSTVRGAYSRDACTRALRRFTCTAFVQRLSVAVRCRMPNAECRFRPHRPTVKHASAAAAVVAALLHQLL